MRLFEIMVSSLKIYHSSAVKILKFDNNPVWFSTSKKSAIKWHNAGTISNKNQITYECEITGKLASEKDGAKFAKQIWPNDEYIYSMFDPKVREFKKDDIDSFIRLLKSNGFIGAYVEDYDPSDFGGDSSTRSLIVFDGTNVKIVNVLKNDLV